MSKHIQATSNGLGTIQPEERLSRDAALLAVFHNLGLALKYQLPKTLAAHRVLNADQIKDLADSLLFAISYLSFEVVSELGCTNEAVLKVVARLGTPSLPTIRKKDTLHD
jgi:hypothetical protein